jgi:hypothetical protein
MAGRNSPSKPAEPKLANKHRQRRTREHESATAVKYPKTEKDVVKLIDCLSEWTLTLQAARSAAAEVSPRRSRSRSRGVVPSVAVKPPYPRGNPLTESMEFADLNGTVWLAYIEGAQGSPIREVGSASNLPDRHLRFDSATESRFTAHLPAGSPFLVEARLQSLLDESQPDSSLAQTTDSPARAVSIPEYRAVALSTRAVESGREAIAAWSRRWQRAGSRMEALGRDLVELRCGAANAMHGMVGALLGHRPARP